MSGKQQKKIRQLFSKTYRHTAEETAKFHGQIIKPKPRWFPEWIWLKLLGIFIKIKD